MRFIASSVICLCTISTAFAHPDDPKVRDHQPPYEGPGYRRAIDGAFEGGPRGGGFDAQGVELLSWITLSEFTAQTGQFQDNGNDCWGYTSPSGREYAIMGLSSGTAFVEVTQPDNAQLIAYIDGPNSLWRDIKVYQHYAYAVSEGGSGIQVIDMANIDAATNRVSLVNTVTSDGAIPTSATHNVALNEESGFLYRCGGSNNGLRIYSLANPASPQFVGQWTDRYVHDCQVVNYTSGPFAGREIAICCSGFNGGSGQTGLDFLDVTDKQNIVNLFPSRITWTNPGYSHQVWLSEDRNYAYVNDELDESNYSLNTRTIVVDVRFLKEGGVSAPSVASTFVSSSTAIGHNLYTLGSFIFEANYRSGLRIFCAEDPISPTEVAYFDTYPDSDSPSFNGAWSTYPYFPSGTVIVSDLERGLFVLDVSKVTKGIQFQYPHGKPTFVKMDGGSLLVADVGPAPCALNGGSAENVTLHYDDGSGFRSVPMSDAGEGRFEGVFGAIPSCYQSVPYYLSAENDLGQTFTNPPFAPGNVLLATSAVSDVESAYDSFETDNGWISTPSSATGGAWQRGVPVNDAGWPFAPSTDGDGSGKCWLTQNTPGDSDVDGGTVRLVSAPFDFTAPYARISYLYYSRFSTPDATDGLTVDISSQGTNGPWVRIRRYNTDGGTEWRSDAIDVRELDFLGLVPNASMRVRFSATDIGMPSIIEAGVDGFRVSALDCTAPCPGADGDLNLDGLIDGQDIPIFSLAVLGTPTTSDVCHGDFSNDLSLNSDDIAGFVDALLGP